MRIKTTLLYSAASIALVISALNVLSYWKNENHDPSFRELSKNRLVCPEHYAGPKHKSETKWVTEECDYAVPMPKLVTIILLDSDLKMASAVQSNLPGVTVIVSGDNQSTDSGSIKYVRPPINATTGVIWNSLISACDTPYALLAANVLNFTLDLGALQRLVRVLSETPGTEVVGGATRNATGHWRASCYQVALQNYALSYRKGYHESTSECMRCDHVDAPFLAATRLLKKVSMDAKLPAKMLLPDFFLKIFRSNNSLLCPDVMLVADDLMTSPAAMDKRQWKSLATRWQLNRIHIRFPRASYLHKFSCSEVGLKCKAIGVKMTKTLPVCCQEEFANCIRFWAKFANVHGISYQFLSGSLLGAVKMEDVIPWDIDGDLMFDRDNYTFVRSSIEEFEKAGIKLINVKNATSGSDFKSWGYLRMMSSGFVIEMYAAPQDSPKNTTRLFSDKAAPPGVNPLNTTKVEIHGVWVTAAPNPGLYARGRYGVDVLKHAMSWRHTGKKNALAPYDAGRFNAPCGGKWHHACLDTMPADGSIFYNVPEY